MEKNQEQGISEERKSLHDLANALTLAQGKLLLLSRSLKQDPKSLTMDEVSERLDQILGTMNRLADLIHTRRDEISR